MINTVNRPPVFNDAWKNIEFPYLPDYKHCSRGAQICFFLWPGLTDSVTQVFSNSQLITTYPNTVVKIYNSFYLGDLNRQIYIKKPRGYHKPIYIFKLISLNIKKKCEISLKWHKFHWFLNEIHSAQTASLVRLHWKRQEICRIQLFYYAKRPLR